MKIETYINHHSQIVVLPSVLYMETDIPDLDMPVAIELTLAPEIQYAWWGNTSRGHTIRYTHYDLSDERIVITDERGNTWRFEPLTLNIFNEKASHFLTPIDKPFTSDEEVQSYYSKTIF